MTSNDDLRHIVDIDKIDKSQAVLLSTLFKRVKTIILESTENSIIGRINSLQTYKDLIIIMDKTISKGIFVFDKSGKFLYKIGDNGQGPGEFVEISDYTLDVKKEKVYVLDNQRQLINVFNLLTGEFAEVIKLKGDYIRSFHLQFIEDCLYTDAYSWKKSEDNFLLREIDIKTGSQINCWMRNFDYNKNSSDLYFTGNGVFYSRNSIRPKFIQLFMDTVISIDQGRIVPYLAIKSKKLLTEKDIENAKGNSIDEKISSFLTIDKIFHIENFIEFGNKVYFEYRQKNMKNFVVYDIDTKKTIVSRRIINDLIYKKHVGQILLPHFCHVDNSGVYGYVHPMEMDKFIESAKRNQLSDNLDKIKIIKSLDSNSNPVIFIYEN
ncbi:hypothetical protein SDC9_122830 [bioreactor metagenome]|uniref:6-bladed beta-propeller n=1 Tax=bioreactor metagenome TaxID=1076179 RepID=A0A645CFR3_9ZZZZ